MIEDPVLPPERATTACSVWGRGSSRCSSSSSSPGSPASSSGPRASRSRSSASISGARRPGIRSRASSARCRSSGARSTRRFWRSLISTPIALGIAIFLSELSPRSLRTPLAFLTELLAAIPSIVYGLWGIFVLVPLVRQLEVLTPAWLREDAALLGPAARRRDALGRAHPGGHGDSVHLLRRARGPEGRSGDAARGRLRARRDALGGDPGGAALRPHGHHRRDHARPRPRHRRDDGGHDGHRQQPAGVARRSSRRSTRWPPSSPTSSPRRPTTST